MLGRYEVWLARIVDFNSDYLKVGLKSNSVLESELKLELEFLIFFFVVGGPRGQQWSRIMGELTIRHWFQTKLL